MKTRIITTCLTALLLVAFATSVSAQNTEQLFQQGIMAEEGEGNLPAAINIFNAIVNDTNAEQALQAKALLHVGLCYEKLGKKEATKAYQKLVNNYPAQKNEVNIAKERLSRLILAEKKTTPISLKPKFTKIKIPTKLSWAVKLSPDGKELVLVSDKKLWKMPLLGNLGPDIPGTPVQLNTGGIEVEWTGLDWSRDGKWIAFNDYPKHDENGQYIETQSIFIVPSNGGEPQKITENFRSSRVVNYRLSLSPDAKKIAFSSIEDNKQHIYSTDINKISPNQLVEMEAREPVFSPDGNYIAFVKDKNKGVDEGDLGLWIVKSEGGTPNKLADAGKASCPIWSPDGRMIAFLDYTQNKQIKIVHVSSTGKANGQIISINAPEGSEEVRLLAGWTPDNRIGALIRTKQKMDIYTLPAEGGQAAMVLNDASSPSQPRWSRDGKQIYFVTEPREGVNKGYQRFLASVPANGGKEHPLTVEGNGLKLNQFYYQSGNRISPDGKWILTSAWTSADTNTVKVHWPTSKIWKVSLDGEDAIKITNEIGNFADQSPCWSADGKSIAFVRFQMEEGVNDIFGCSPKIYRMNSEGGEPELLVSVSGKYVNSVIWSPDGNTIAYLTGEINEPHTRKLNLYDIITKETKSIDITSANAMSAIVWSPDSKRIAFTDEDEKVIKIITLSDQRIEEIKTGLVDVNIFNLDWSSDGKRFVFCGWQGGEPEFWFLEDFLPPDKLAEQHFKKGNELYRQWEYESAIEEYKKAMKPDPKSLVALNAQYCMGQSLLQLGKYELALETFRKLVEKNPKSNIAPVTELMIAQVENEIKENLLSNDIDISEDKNVITDSETGISYRKVKSFAGKDDIISHTGGLNLSPDARFVILENRVVPLDGSAPFNLVDEDYVYRAVYSPKMNKAAFFADSAIWTIPVSPLTGKAAGKPVRLLDGDYDFQSIVSWSPDGEKIAFVRNDSLVNGDIWTLSLNGGKLNAITNEKGYEKCPVWSPDGKSVVYDGDGYCLAPINGENHKRIAQGGGYPYWSPDGRWLIFAQSWGKQRLYSLDSGKEMSFNIPKKVGRFLGFKQNSNKMFFFRSSFDDQWGLKVVSVNGGPSFKPALDNPVYDEMWLNDNKHLVIQSDDKNEKTQLKIISLSGNSVVPVTINANVKGIPFPFSCSRDFSHLAFSVKKGNDKEDLYVIPFSIREGKTHGPAQMIFKDWTGGAYNVSFNWSKDGSKVVLTNKGNIWVVPLKGEPKQITSTEENKRWLKWSPDGKWISYIVPSKNQTAILKMISADGKISKIIDDKNKASCWSPDSKNLAVLSDNQIKIVTGDGKLLKNIAGTGKLGLTVISDFQYSPDGKHLAFIGYNKDEDAIIYLYSFEENKFTKLAFDVTDDYKYSLRWSPDGKWLSYLTYEQEKVRPEGILWEADFEDLKEKVALKEQNNAKTF